MFWKDVQQEMGKPQSTFMATFSHDLQRDVGIRQQVEDLLVKNKVFGSMVNEAFKLSEQEAWKDKLKKILAFNERWNATQLHAVNSLEDKLKKLLDYNDTSNETKPNLEL